ncbi:hypothetical protein [Streptomyces sp. NPDC029004]|uniref:hypothetical protein n=1 Tax=Streptomyces sp. NPDC029004 TaxID=3154490 RepID=UPI0033E011D7
MPTLMIEGTLGESLEETVLAHAEHLEWLLQPIHRCGGDLGLTDGVLVFPMFSSMNQTWSRAGG